MNPTKVSKPCCLTNSAFFGFFCTYSNLDFETLPELEVLGNNIVRKSNYYTNYTNDESTRTFKFEYS